MGPNGLKKKKQNAISEIDFDGLGMLDGSFEELCALFPTFHFNCDWPVWEIGAEVCNDCRSEKHTLLFSRVAHFKMLKNVLF